MKKILAICLSALLALTTLPELSVQASSGEITCHASFLIWLNGQSEVLDDIQNVTLAQLSSEDNRTNVKTMRNNLKTIFAQYESESANLDEATYNVSVLGIIQSVERDVEQFQTTCQEIIEAETGSFAQLNMAKDEAIELLHSMEGCATHEQTTEKYKQLYDTYLVKISQASTVVAVGNICDKLNALSTELALQDGLIGIMIDDIDMSLYSAENQILVNDLMNEYSLKVLAYDGETLMSEFDDISMQLILDFNEALGSIPTIEEEDADIYLSGDITGDGKVNIKDWNSLYEHINEIHLLDDDELLRADVTGEGKVNIKDWNRIYEHITEVNPLW